MRDIKNENAIQQIIDQQNQEHEFEKVWTDNQYDREGQLISLAALEMQRGKKFPNLTNNGHTKDLSQLSCCI